MRVLRRLLVNSVSAKESWFMIGWSRSQIKSARLSHVTDLIACSLTLGLLIIFDIVRRILGAGEPHSWFMIGFGFIALIANVICLVLIRKHNNGEVHMRASWIFSANDVIANMGVIAAGVLVMLLDSRWPDIVIGSVIATLILRGAYLIITDAKKELSNAELTSENNGCSGSKSKSCS